MTARAAVAQILYEDPGMISLGFTEGTVWQANALDTPVPNTPFIVIANEGKERAFAAVGVQLLAYWVHLPRTRYRDYTLIDMTLDRIEEILVDANQFVGEDGYVLTSASFVDRSRDLIDEAFNTITKYSTFRAATHSVVAP